jgi:hypothetical protein
MFSEAFAVPASVVAPGMLLLPNTERLQLRRRKKQKEKINKDEIKSY